MNLLSQSQLRLISDFKARVKQTEALKQHNEDQIPTNTYKNAQDGSPDRSSVLDASNTSPYRSIRQSPLKDRGYSVLVKSRMSTRNPSMSPEQPHRQLNPVVFNGLNFSLHPADCLYIV